jgi:hypothetical protein
MNRGPPETKQGAKRYNARFVSLNERTGITLVRTGLNRPRTENQT